MSYGNFGITKMPLFCKNQAEAMVNQCKIFECTVVFRCPLTSESQKATPFSQLCHTSLFHSYLGLLISYIEDYFIAPTATVLSTIILIIVPCLFLLYKLNPVLL